MAAFNRRDLRQIKPRTLFLFLLVSGGVVLLTYLGTSADTTLAFRGSVPAAPWMDSRERALVERYLSKDKEMLEYGSGGSTRTYAPQVRRYLAVESDPVWCAAMAVDLVGSSADLDLEIVCQGPEVAALPCVSFASRAKEALGFGRCYSRYRDFVRYIQAPLHHDLDRRYDIVLVDGRARPQAAVDALFLLRGADSVVIMHDWNARKGYHEVLRFYNIVGQQKESGQGGGGGLVVLTPKPQWWEQYQDWTPPEWWF